MSLWEYDIDHAPPQAYEAVEATAALIKTASLISGALYLGSNDYVYAHEEPVEKPARWVVVREYQVAGGQAVSHTGFQKVQLHVKVVSDKEMSNSHRWHAAMHARIQRSIVGKTLTLTRSETGLRIRKLTEPSRPEYYEDTDTRESFTLYAITLQPNQQVPQ